MKKEFNLEAEICFKICKIFKPKNSIILEYKYIPAMIKEGISEGIKEFMSTRCPNCKALIKDYEFIEEQASEVYCEVTGGMMSKGNYYAKDIIALADEHYEKMWKDYIYSDLEDILRRHGDTGRKKELINEIREYFK